MFCENCGALLTGGGKFCPECGAAVTVVVQNKYKKELEQGGQAFAYMPDEEPVSMAESTQGLSDAPAQNYAYSADTIRAVEEEMDSPSKAAEYKQRSDDWRDRIDSDKFRRQNEQGSFSSETRDMYNTYNEEYSDKSFIAAALLAFFLGGFGAHNFYLGYTKKAVIQLILTLLTLFTLGMSGAVAGIWAFVEFILILIGNIDRDADGKLLKR